MDNWSIYWDRKRNKRRFPLGKAYFALPCHSQLRLMVSGEVGLEIKVWKWCIDAVKNHLNWLNKTIQEDFYGWRLNALNGAMAQQYVEAEKKGEMCKESWERFEKWNQLALHGYMGMFLVLFFEECAWKLMEMHKLSKHLTWEGENITAESVFFLLTGRTEAVDTYLVEKEFSYECFSQWSMEQDCQPRLRGQEWSGVRMGYYEKVFWGLLHKDLCGVKCMRCFEVLCVHLFHHALSYKIW